MTSVECEQTAVDEDIVRGILSDRSGQIISEDVTSIDKETFKELFRNHTDHGINSDKLLSELFNASNRSENCSGPYMLTMGEGRPLSEEVISWVLATLPMGAMVSSSRIVPRIPISEFVILVNH